MPPRARNSTGSVDTLRELTAALATVRAAEKEALLMQYGEMTRLWDNGRGSSTEIGETVGRHYTWVSTVAKHYRGELHAQRRKHPDQVALLTEARDAIDHLIDLARRGHKTKGGLVDYDTETTAPAGAAS